MNKLAFVSCLCLVLGASALQASFAPPNAAYLGIRAATRGISEGIVGTQLMLEDSLHTSKKVVIARPVVLNFPVSVFFPSSSLNGTSITDPNLDYITYELSEPRFKVPGLVSVNDMFVTTPAVLKMSLSNSGLLMQPASSSPLNQPFPVSFDGGTAYRCYAIKATAANNPGIIGPHGNLVTREAVRLFGSDSSNPVFNAIKPLRFCVPVIETLKKTGHIIYRPVLPAFNNNLLCYSLNAELSSLPFGSGAKTLDHFGTTRLLFVDDLFTLCVPASFPP